MMREDCRNSRYAQKREAKEANAGHAIDHYTRSHGEIHMSILHDTDTIPVPIPG